MAGRAAPSAGGGGGGGGSPRPKKQNHANIPCPIENCARFTYGKLPDHLTKRHGLVGAERDAVNERQRKRFFNGELCQVRFLKEAAIRELWGDDYDDPHIRAKIHDTCSMVKIRIIPLAATARARPLTEQDANVLTNYNARTEGRGSRRRAPAAPAAASPPPAAKRIKWGDDENRAGRASPPPSPSPSPAASPASEAPSPGPPLPPTPPRSARASPAPPAPDARLPDILDSKIDDGYKFVIDDMKRSMGAGRALAPRKRKMHRTYRRYARRLIAYLHRQHSPLAYDVDLLLCGEPQVRAFLERIGAYFKPKTVRNYIVAAMKLLECRLLALETDAACREKAHSMSRLYDALHRRLRDSERTLAARSPPLPPLPPAPLRSPPTQHAYHLADHFDPTAYSPVYETTFNSLS